VLFQLVFMNIVSNSLVVIIVISIDVDVKS